MPIYEYKCTKCGQVEEAFQRFSEKPLSKCRHCSGKLHKLISQSAFHLKGSGWYANKSKTSSTKSKQAENASSDSGTSSASTDTPKDSAS
jgi:putative FmdB family regulatory protein